MIIYSLKDFIILIQFDSINYQFNNEEDNIIFFFYFSFSFYLTEVYTMKMKIYLISEEEDEALFCFIFSFFDLLDVIKSIFIPTLLVFLFKVQTLISNNLMGILTPQMA